MSKKNKKFYLENHYKIHLEKHIERPKQTDGMVT